MFRSAYKRVGVVLHSLETPRSIRGPTRTSWAVESRKHDWRLVPLAVGVWAGALAGTSEHWWLVAVCWLALLPLWPLSRRKPWLAIGLAGCALIASMSGLVAHQRASSAAAELAQARAIVQMEIRVVSEPRPRAPKPPMPPSSTMLAEAQWLEGRGHRSAQRLPVLVTASGELGDELLELVPGGRYEVEARLAATREGDSVVAVARVREIVGQVGEPGPLERIAAAMRQGLRDAVVHSPPSQRALVPSLVVGDTSRVDALMEADFKSTGLTHLMAVSGANLALMLGAVLAALRFVGVRGWSVRGVAFGGVVMFVIICGPEPSVQRAAWMGLVALASTGVGKGRRSVRALSVAVIALMAIDPWLSRAPGFWLSVAACLGIVVLGPSWIEALTRWAPRWVAEGLAIPLSAQIATQPIVTWLSGEVSLVGVLANVAAGPFVGPTTVLGFAAACTVFLPSVSVVFGWLAGWCAQPILWVASIGAGLPSSTMAWEPGLMGVLLMAVVSAAGAVLLTPLLRHALASFVAFCLLLGAILARPSPPGWPGAWSVAFCDVGQGDATVFRVDSTTAVLVDTGGESQPVIDCLHGLGVNELAMIVITHFHADHVGGFEGVVERFPPSLVLTSATLSPEAAAEKVLANARAPARAAVAGELLQIGSFSWQTVSAPLLSVPSSADDGESVVENDSSVIAVAAVDGIRVLITGDVDLEGQALATRQARDLGLSLEADIVSLPHHGASKQDPRFLGATKAGLAVVSAGESNSYGHPAPSTLSLVRELGMSVVRTDEQGTLAVGRDGEDLVVRGAG